MIERVIKEIDGVRYEFLQLTAPKALSLLVKLVKLSP